jgi:hypothetical protein
LLPLHLSAAHADADARRNGLDLPSVFLSHLKQPLKTSPGGYQYPIWGL